MTFASFTPHAELKSARSVRGSTAALPCRVPLLSMSGRSASRAGAGRAARASRAGAPRLPPPRRVARRADHLSKVSLEKKGRRQPGKEGQLVGEIIINSTGRAAEEFFGGGAIDLDLGCLIEMRWPEGVVQAPAVLGAYQIHPSSVGRDDRTVMSARAKRSGSTARVAVDQARRDFAIFDGARMAADDGVVTVTMPISRRSKSA